MPCRRMGPSHTPSYKDDGGAGLSQNGSKPRFSTAQTPRAKRAVVSPDGFMERPAGDGMTLLPREVLRRAVFGRSRTAGRCTDKVQVTVAIAAQRRQSPVAR